MNELKHLKNSLFLKLNNNLFELQYTKILNNYIN